MRIVRLDHVQLAMPPGREEEAIAFFEGLLGVPHVPKPEHLAARGGCWFERGDLKVHLGVEDDFRPAGKAHPAFIVEGVRALAGRIVAAGHRVVEDEPLSGYDRIYVYDPFGNRIELMEPLGGAPSAAGGGAEAGAGAHGGEAAVGGPHAAEAADRASVGDGGLADGEEPGAVGHVVEQLHVQVEAGRDEREVAAVGSGGGGPREACHSPAHSWAPTVAAVRPFTGPD